VFDFLASVLLLEHPDGLDEAARAELLQFTLQFQQLTGPVTAKGYEDTALYRFYPLASFKKVSGDPASFGLTLQAFHLAMRSGSRSGRKVCLQPRPTTTLPRV
jgi:(1->4)-alpha-D-glucan 1-alpha-D-glucosylmutase